jgi:hypothetical protein
MTVGQKQEPIESSGSGELGICKDGTSESGSREAKQSMNRTIQSYQHSTKSKNMGDGCKGEDRFGSEGW